MTVPTKEFRLKGKDSQTFRYLVEMSGPGWVEFQVDSRHGDKATQPMEIRGGN